MKYPQVTDYQDAIQDPRLSFLDPELRAGTVTKTPLGLPRVWSGGFALTYEVRFGGRTYAVRCFHREVPAIEKKYAAISKKLKALTSEHFVDFIFNPLASRSRAIHILKYPLI